MAENNFNTQGGYFAPANYFKVEAGGSHDENPNGGVQIGVDSQGIPNMLEEGEPVYDDYVFSDNIKAEKDILSKLNIPSKYAGKLYSEIADAFVDEAEERPLDSVSNNGLRSMLSRLADAQEEQKQKQQEKELEEELANMSPEELAELEAMLAEQENGQAQMYPVEQQVMANGGDINIFGNGGGHGGGTRTQPEAPYTGEILPDYRFRPILDLSDTRLGRGLSRFNNSALGRVVNFVTPSNATSAFTPAIKPAAGVQKLMDEAYRTLELEKASEAANKAAEVAADAAKNGSAKKVWNVAKYFVDPSAVWRNGWKPTGFLGKVAKGAVGTLHSGAVSTAEAGAVGKAIDKGIDISKSSKLEEFDVDPFSGRKFDIGGKVIRQFVGGTPGRVVVVPNTYTGGSWNWFDRYSAEPVKFNYGLNLSGVSGSSGSSAGTKKVDTLPRVDLIKSDDTLLKNGLVDTRKFKKTRLGYYEDGNYVSEPTIVSPETMRENMTSKYGYGAYYPSDTNNTYSTWPRYVAPAMHGALALTDAFTPPTKFKYQRFAPQTVSGQINLEDMRYQPIPLDYMSNQALANSAGTIRALRESGLVNPAAAIIAADNNIGQNLGNTLLSGWQANNAQRNQVVQFNNANRGTEADFNYRLALANAAARERAQMSNIQHDLYIQRLNDAAESEQYAAISNELGHAMEGLSGIGTENFNMNMANSVYPYVIDKNGHVRYIKPSACGGLLKTYKK